MGIAASRFTNDPKYFLENATPSEKLHCLMHLLLIIFNRYNTGSIDFRFREGFQWLFAH